MKQHRFDVISFVAGLFFTGIGLLFLIPTDISRVWDVLVDWSDWFWPLALLAVGVATIAGAVLTKRKSEDEPQPASAD